MAWDELIIPSWLLKESFSKLHNSKALPKNFGWNWMLQGALWLKASASDYTVPVKSCRYLGIVQTYSYKNAHLMHTMFSKHLLSLYMSANTSIVYSTTILWHSFAINLGELGHWQSVPFPPHLQVLPPSTSLHCSIWHHPCLKWTKSLCSNFRIENLDLFRGNIPDLFQHLPNINEKKNTNV